MARLVGVCAEVVSEFSQRQLPLLIDEELTVLIQFPDISLSCNTIHVKQKEQEKFNKKLAVLSETELSAALVVHSQDLFSGVAQMVPCVGCRKSVERMFNQIAESDLESLDPLQITADHQLTVSEELLSKPKTLCGLFLRHGQKLNVIIEAISKSKKNRRCPLHSLDSQRIKPPSWCDVWDLMAKECREEVVVVELEILLETLESYLKKHRFCDECRAKVMRAYHILVGEVDQDEEKGFVPTLYEGLRCCPPDDHVHVKCDTEFIAQLIDRADPELRGSRREKHAKTMELAQEEILTCLGVCLYQRMTLLWQRLKEEEQTWQMLLYLGLNCLQKSFEMSVERKQGVSQLELICEEIKQAEVAKQLRKELKRQKRKKRRNKDEKRQVEGSGNNKDQIAECTCEGGAEGEYCTCFSTWQNENDENTPTNSPCPITCECASSRCPRGFCKHDHNPLDCPSAPQQHTCTQCSCLTDLGPGSGKVTGSYSDCGYSSGGTSIEPSWSPTSSCESSEVACTDGFCNHEDSGSMNGSDPDILRTSCKECSGLNQSTNIEKTQPIVQNNSIISATRLYNQGPSLQDMLQESSMNGDDPVTIPAEMVRLQAQLPQLNRKRLELRQKLRRQFAELQNSNKQFLIRPRTPQLQ